MKKPLTLLALIALCGALPVSAAGKQAAKAQAKVAAPKAASNGMPNAAPKLSPREAAALDFYGVARNLESGYALCQERKAGNSDSLKDILGTMQGLSDAYFLGKQLYEQGKRNPDIVKMDKDMEAKSKSFPGLNQEEVDSYCSLLGISTIFTVQGMADQLNQFAPDSASTDAGSTPSAASDASASAQNSSQSR